MNTCAPPGRNAFDGADVPKWIDCVAAKGFKLAGPPSSYSECNGDAGWPASDFYLGLASDSGSRSNPAEVIRALADTPPATASCGEMAGYEELLKRYAPLIENADRADGGATPEMVAVRYLQYRAGYARTSLYQLATGRSDSDSLAPEPEPTEREAQMFDCLGDYLDSRAQAARLKALAAELRTKEAERKRCETDPICRPKQEAEDMKRVAQSLVSVICTEIAERRDMKTNIANNSRRSAVPERQDMKETLLFLDKQIVDKSALYRDMTGLRFSAKLCK